MNRIFLLRAYGDFVIFLQAILRSNKKHNYSIVASSHLEPLYKALSSFKDMSHLQIQFVDFGIKKGQLRLFTNRHLIHLETLRELKKIHQFIQQYPNKDGIDDKFIILRPGGSTVQLKIFNRWGNVVYQNNNYQNDWDGRSQHAATIGQELPVSTYYYILDLGNGEEAFHGFVYLKR